MHLGINSSDEKMKAVIEKYKKNLGEETLALSVKEKLDNPMIVKGIVLGEYAVNLQIGL